MPSSAAIAGSSPYQDQFARHAQLNLPPIFVASLYPAEPQEDPRPVATFVPPRPPAPERPRDTFSVALNEIDQFDEAIGRPAPSPGITVGGRTATFDSSAAADHLRNVVRLVTLPSRFKDEPYAAADVYSPELRAEAARFAEVKMVAAQAGDPSRPDPAYVGFLDRVRQEQSEHAGLRALSVAPRSPAGV